MSWREKIKSVLHNLRYVKQERGAIFVLTALLLPVLFGFLGLGYDVGNLYVHKARLQNTADATALAGGREYVNALKTAINAANNSSTTTRPPTDAEKIAARTPMVAGANKYIANNNPVFNAKEGRLKKYEIGVQTNSDSSKTEFFRVTLTEPVQVTFLRVLPGIPEKANVSVYATVRLSDTAEGSGGGTSHDIRKEKYKPVIITTKEFYDEINRGYPSHQLYNFYNGEIYTVNGSITKDAPKDENGHYVTYSSGMVPSEIAELEYDVNAFGEAIKNRFIEKQNYSDSGLSLYQSDKEKWKKGYPKYLKEYQEWLKSAPTGTRQPNSLAEMQEIFNCLMSYWTEYDYNNYNDLYNRWLSEGKPLTNSKDKFRNLINICYLKGENWVIPNESNWESLRDNVNYPWSGSGNPYPGLYIVTERGGKQAPTVTAFTGGLDHDPKITDSKYGTKEYYMSYKGTRSDLMTAKNVQGGSVTAASALSTKAISSHPEDFGLNANEHNYFYVSAANNPAGWDNGKNVNLDILVDGFYEVDKISNTPFYLFVDSDINIINVFFKKCNRPFVLYYTGTHEIHYEFCGIENNSFRGILYTPFAGGDTHLNADNGFKFSGSLVTQKIAIRTHDDTYTYDSNEISNWMKNTEIDEETGQPKNPDGLPCTPNIGFADSGAQIITEGGNTSSQTTWPEHLQLVLKNQYNVSSWENISE